jgi:hypothetical protein
MATRYTKTSNVKYRCQLNGQDIDFWDEGEGGHIERDKVAYADGPVTAGTPTRTDMTFKKVATPEDYARRAELEAGGPLLVQVAVKGDDNLPFTEPFAMTGWTLGIQFPEGNRAESARGMLTMNAAMNVPSA